MKFFLLLFSIVFTISSCSSPKGIAPSQEVKQPVPAYWNDDSVEGLIDPQNCEGEFDFPRLAGGIGTLENRIELPDDGNKYYQVITAAFFITEEGKAEKIWFPNHTESIATEAVKEAVLGSEFEPPKCDGKPGVTKYAVTVHARN